MPHVSGMEPPGANELLLEGWRSRCGFLRPECSPKHDRGHHRHYKNCTFDAHRLLPSESPSTIPMRVLECQILSLRFGINPPDGIGNGACALPVRILRLQLGGHLLPSVFDPAALDVQ